MGHKEAIVLILIFPHVIILVLEEKEELTHTKHSLVSHTCTQPMQELRGLQSLPRGQHWPFTCPSVSLAPQYIWAELSVSEPH